jgi:hypothetical protein
MVKGSQHSITIIISCGDSSKFKIASDFKGIDVGSHFYFIEFVEDNNFYSN